MLAHRQPDALFAAWLDLPDTQRQGSPLLGAALAREIRSLLEAKQVHRLEDGPVGGTPLRCGADQMGSLLDAPLPKAGGWNLSRISDLSLAQVAYQLETKKCVWLPTTKKSDARAIPVITVSELGSIGPYHMDINGETSTGGIRGPFDVRPIVAGRQPTYPVLWAHEAERERRFVFPADCEGLPLVGKTRAEKELIDEKVAALYATASHCHFNRDFRFNSQATAMQFTEEPTIGGRAWLSIRLTSLEQEKALVLWANTSLGILMYWWHSNKQQSGRGQIGKSALETLHVLDVGSLQEGQLSAALEIFDDLKTREFRPAHEIDTDAARKELDERFGREVLQLPQALFAPNGPLDLIRRKMAEEPSIRGAK